MTKTFTKVSLPVKITQTELFRLCYAWQIVDPKGKSGIRTNSIAVLFARCLQKMPKLFQKRVAGRPRIHGYNKLEMHNDETKDKHFVKGWTELGILLQVLHSAMPGGVFASPLEMCLT